MPAAYPTLANGVIVQLPFQRTRSFRTAGLDVEWGMRYAFTLYQFPLMTWLIQYRCSDADLQTIQAHWESAEGALETFQFTDPATGTEYPKVRYDQAALDVAHEGPDENVFAVRLKECR